MNLATIENLPQELIEQVLSYSSITFKDVCGFSSTCTKFKLFCNSNELWHCKFKQTWPELIILYEKNHKYNWFEEYFQCYTCGKMLYEKLSQMSSQYYCQDELSRGAFTQFSQINDHPLSYHFCVNKLEKILNDGKIYENLTDKYYGIRVLHYLKHKYLKKQWELYMSLPEEIQLLEKGAVLLAQWCQTSEPISEHSINQQLNSLAQETLDRIEISHPKHPVTALKIKTPSSDLKKSLWSPDDCRIVLNALNNVLFNEIKFSGNRDDYYNALNSYINKVLNNKTGIPITLCIVYKSLASRLGVLCQPVNFPGHFILKWEEFPHLSPLEQYSYIDVFENGKFMSQESCQNLIPGQAQLSTTSYNVAKPIQVFHRMCWNLVEVGRQRERIGVGIVFLQNILELLLILKPEGIEHKLLLAGVYLHSNINLDEVIEMLREIGEQDPASRVANMQAIAQSQINTQSSKDKQKITPKCRSVKNRNVEFCVGLIMTHKKYNYNCIIFGWDPKCAASRDWIFQMGVHNLPKKNEQPFYNVLVDDGSNRYAAQENLTLAIQPKPFNHPEIGKHFHHFRNTHFIPNDEKSQEYPNDIEFRNKLLAQAYPNTKTT